MIKRIALETLNKWKANPNRKPLIIRGARQVGKTSLVRAFGRQFNVFIELNLEKESERSLFEISDVKKILSSIYLYKNVIPKSGQTLLFIDEIQESPKAIAQLRYFLEELPDLYVIAAGSLLEFALDKVGNFPVGRVDYLYLHPLNFVEYLGAFDQNVAVDAISQVPIPAYAHDILKQHFHDYALVGGMPELVAQYVKEKNPAALGIGYRKIWQSYKDDVEKYARNETEKRVIRHVIATAPFEMDRIKFEKFGNSNYRSREVGEAIRALDLARIIQLVYPTVSVKPPVVVDFKKRPRLQYLDTGLWNEVLGLKAEMIKVDDLDLIHKGRIIQHLVAQEINSTFSDFAFMGHFWVREEKDSSSEVDFIYPFDKYLIPIEVKSGSSGSLRSLHQFIDRCGHPFAVRFYAGKFQIEEAKTVSGTSFFLMNLPYYLGTQIDAYLRYFTSRNWTL